MGPRRYGIIVGETRIKISVRSQPGHLKMRCSSSAFSGSMWTLNIGRWHSGHSGRPAALSKVSSAVGDMLYQRAGLA